MSESIDWDAWLAHERDAIDAARGITNHKQTQPATDDGRTPTARADKEHTMPRPRNSDIRMWWHTPWADLTTHKKAQAVKLYQREHGDYDAVAVGVLLETTPELTLIEAIRLIAEQPDAASATAETAQEDTPTPAIEEQESAAQSVDETEPALADEPTGLAVTDLPVGTIADELPESCHAGEEAPEVRHARLALEHPGKYILHRIVGTPDKPATSKRAHSYASAVRRGNPKAFGPKGRFAAKAIEVAEGVYQIWVWAVQSEEEARS